ncbi:hypothetical protein [Amycolatopsis sp. RTGN1]|uniref:hypothetical protein n=1 Tax=Amycolatopsis ponsaeliensis TaxID=2992142 RepID=UPI00254BB78F|nr:hypothetical protein [Amycolatopsis sp. RTGN1]
MVNYAPPTPTSGRSSRIWPWIALAIAALVVGVIVGRWVLPSDPAPAAQPGTSATPSSGAVGGPHGPAKITQGVPSGYTHDQAGAATAGVNAVQLIVNVAHGQADSATAGKTWTASNADEAARAALSAGPDSPGSNQTSKLPATTRVTAYSDSSATVEIWVVSVGSTSGIGGASTADDWSTHTVRLSWENGDWKVSSLRASKGPKPGDTGTTPSTTPLTNGLYTYYIN